LHFCDVEAKQSSVMPLFKKRRNDDDDTPADAPGAADRLLDQTEILDRLEEEIFRADRYGRSLVVLCALPQLTTGEALGAAGIATAWEALSAQLRFSDRVGILNDGAFVAVLPETDAQSARVIAHRLAADLTVRSTGANRRNWLVGIGEWPVDGSDPPALVEAAMSRAQR
jgi:GGDEF domain-containing protein